MLQCVCVYVSNTHADADKSAVVCCAGMHHMLHQQEPVCGQLTTDQHMAHGPDYFNNIKTGVAEMSHLMLTGHSEFVFFGMTEVNLYE